MQLARSTNTIGRPQLLQRCGHNPDNRKVQYMKVPRRLRVKLQAVGLLEPCKVRPINYPVTSATTSQRCVTSQKSEGLTSM
jgi:hypothetical protein